MEGARGWATGYLLEGRLCLQLEAGRVAAVVALVRL